MWVALHGGGMGGGNEGKVVGRWAYLRPVVCFVVDPLASAGRWHLTWWVRGAAQGGRRAMWWFCKKGRTPEPPPRTPHTPEKPGPPGVPSKVWVSKGRSGRVVASSVPLCLQEEGQGMGQGDAACPRRGMCHLHRLCPVLLRFVKAMESVRR